jgi:thioester reductase-like protein
VLGRDAVGVHQNFFELGGDSLRAIQVVARARELGVAIEPRQIFEHQTVAALATCIASGGSILPGSDVDFRADAQLDPAIVPLRPLGPRARLARVLLTGASGFLGVYLTRALARRGITVVCVVRAADAHAAAERLRSAYQQLGLSFDEVRDRLVPVVGDLTASGLGIDEAASAGIDAIFHNGAFVNFALPYRSLVSANVRGTETVLRIAAAAGVDVHHISTLSVFPRGTASEALRELDAPDAPERLRTGYAQSKWVAERLVRHATARGLVASIYRPSAITGDSATGAFNAADLVGQALIACATLGAAPDIDLSLDMVPVDWVADSIAEIATRSIGSSGVYHLASPTPVSIRELATLARDAGYPVELLPLDAWRARFRELAARGPSAAFAALAAAAARDPDPGDAAPAFDARNTVAALAGTAHPIPPSVGELLPRYFETFVQAGLLRRATDPR